MNSACAIVDNKILLVGACKFIRVKDIPTDGNKRMQPDMRIIVRGTRSHEYNEKSEPKRTCAPNVTSGGGRIYQARKWLEEKVWWDIVIVLLFKY